MMTSGENMSKSRIKRAQQSLVTGEEFAGSQSKPEIIIQLESMVKRLEPIARQGEAVKGLVEEIKLDEIASSFSMLSNLKNVDIDDAKRKFLESQENIKELSRAVAQDLSEAGSEIKRAVSGFSQIREVESALSATIQLTDAALTPLEYATDALTSAVLPSELADSSLAPIRAKKSPASVSFSMKGPLSALSASSEFLGMKIGASGSYAFFKKSLPLEDIVKSMKDGKFAGQTASTVAEENVYFAQTSETINFPSTDMIEYDIKDAYTCYANPKRSLMRSRKDAVLKTLITSESYPTATVTVNSKSYNFTFDITKNTFVMSNNTSIKFSDMLMYSESGFFTKNSIIEEALDKNLSQEDTLEFINEVGAQTFGVNNWKRVEAKRYKSIITKLASQSDPTSNDDIIFSIHAIKVLENIGSKLESQGSDGLKVIYPNSSEIDVLASQMDELKDMLNSITSDADLRLSSLVNARDAFRGTTGPRPTDLTSLDGIKQGLKNLTEKLTGIDIEALSDSESQNAVIKNPTKIEEVGKVSDGDHGIISWVCFVANLVSTGAIIYQAYSLITSLLEIYNAGELFDLSSWTPILKGLIAALVSVVTSGPQLENLFAEDGLPMKIKDSFLRHKALIKKISYGVGAVIVATVLYDMGNLLAANDGDFSVAYEAFMESDSLFGFGPSYSSLFNMNTFELAVEGATFLMSSLILRNKIREFALSKIEQASSEFLEEVAKFLGFKIIKDVGFRVAKTSPHGKKAIKFIERNLKGAGGDPNDPSNYSDTEFFANLSNTLENILEFIIPGYDQIIPNTDPDTANKIISRTAEEMVAVSAGKVKAIFLERVNAPFSNRALMIDRRSNMLNFHIKKIAVLAKFLEKYTEESIMLHKLMKKAT